MQTAISHPILTAVQPIARTAKQTYSALTSAQAQEVYRVTGRAILTVILLSVASVLLLVDMGRAVHRWAQAHKDWTYQDFEDTARERVRDVVYGARCWVSDQCDRASVFLQDSQQAIACAARSEMLKIREAAAQKVLGLAVRISP